MGLKLLDEHERMLFATADDFRAWLQVNCMTSDGIWLVLGKPGGPRTLSSEEALEEALCFGWVDSLIHRIDEKTYLKYFSPRRVDSKWSARNITLVHSLEESGRMTDFGRAKIKEATQRGLFQAQERPTITREQIESLVQMIREIEPAYTNFLAMSPSVQRTYTAFYLDAKTEQGRKSRLDRIVDRLNQNLKPM